MSGPLTVSKEVFLARRAQYSSSHPRSAALILKYESLFKSHDCFSVVNKSPAVQAKYHKQRKPHHSSHYHVANKDPKKTLQSLWNTLNDANYPKILQKLRLQVTSANLEHIISELIKAAIIHSCYRKHFIRMIIDLMGLWDRERICHVIKTWFQDVMLGSFYYFSYDEDTSSPKNEYDMFCLQQKHKQKTLSHNAFLLDVYDMIPCVSLDIDTYISRVLTGFLNHKGDESYTDLFLHMLYDISVRHKQLEQHIYVVKSACDNLSIKNKFLFEKVVNQFGL